MKKSLGVVLGLSFALLTRPAAAQVRVEVGVLGTWVHSTTTTVTDATYDLGVKFEDGAGGGLFVDVRPLRVVSFTLSGFRTRQSGAITAGGSTLVSVGRLDSTAGVLEAKLHPLGDGTIDPWIGAGGTYVSFKDLSDPALNTAGIGDVSVKGTAGFVGSAGVRWQFVPSAAFLVDAKYLAVKPKSQGVAGPQTELRWNPLFVSAGFGFRF